jgi:hypothetical protein
MELFGLIFLVVALVLIGVGIALGLAGLAALTALVGMGVVSSSLIVGLRTGRSSAGIRVFLLQCGVLAGIPAGAVCAMLAKFFFDHIGNAWVVPAYGALGGAFAGALVALMLDAVSRRLHIWTAARIAKINPTPAIPAITSSSSVS